MSNENQATNTAREYAQKMDLALPATMEELAQLQEDYLAEASRDESGGSDLVIELGGRQAFGFTALTGIDFEEELFTNYCLKASEPEVASFMLELTKRVMTGRFQVVWAAGYGDAASRIDSFREIIESDLYHFESEELASLLSLTHAGESWTYAAMGERVVFVKLEDAQ